MKPIHTLSFLLVGLCALTGIASGQTAQDYYYYEGKKVFLEVDQGVLSIALEGEAAVSQLQKSFKGREAKLSDVVEDHTKSMTLPLGGVQRKNNTPTYYTEVALEGTPTLAAYRHQVERYSAMPHVISAAPVFSTKTGGKLGLSPHFYVKLRRAGDISLLYERAGLLKAEVLGRDKYMPLWMILSVTPASEGNALNLANAFYETGDFAAAEPAFVYHDLKMSNDPLYPQQWSLRNTGQNGGTAGMDINMEQAWGITAGAASVRTAVFDHGLEMNHPDLSANVYSTGFDATTGTSPAQVRGSHGTACAGIVGAVRNNNLGISGVAPNSKLMSVSIRLVFGDTPQQLASGFSWAWRNGASVISNSWGGYNPSSIITDAIQEALDKGRAGKGTVIVFAAGNEDNTNIRYPGNSIPDILLVGAMSPCGERKSKTSCDGEGWWGSCYGKVLDVMAPGVKMPTTDRQGGSGYSATDYTSTFNGTSSACPVVAGVAALVLSANPNLSARQVNDIIEQTAQKVRTDLYNYQNTSGRPNGTWHVQMGYGLVDAYRAVLLARSYACPRALTIIPNVYAGESDIRSAGSTLTAQSRIYSGATAKYRAGSKVILRPGFRAYPGSDFRAYTGACSFPSGSPAPLVKETGTGVEPLASFAVSPDSGDEPGLSLYPNPTKGDLTITTDFREGEAYRAELYDFKGRRVRSKMLSSRRAQLSLDGLEAGPYLLKVITGERYQTRKVLLQR